MEDLERAFIALRAKQDLYSTLWDYYEGRQPLKYSTQRLKAVFQTLDARFSENWASVVIDSMLDKVTLETFDVANNETMTERLNQLWQESELDLDEEVTHKAAAVIGEAFIVAWRDDGQETEAYYNDPRLMHVVYDEEHPRQMRFAAKWWETSEDTLRMTLYYTDRIENYESSKASTDVMQTDNGWQDLLPMEENWPANPYGEIPVFHFKAERRGVISMMHNALEPQDALNKLLNDMMVAAEFGAFRQRWIITNAENTEIRAAPYANWFLPGSDGEGQATQVGEFGQTELSNFIAALEREATVISAITRTPKHYFFGQGGDPSGEALIAMEAPLNAKAGRFIKLQVPVWRRLAAFLLKLDGTTIEEGDIAVVFDEPQTIQPRTEAEILNMNVQAGIPLKTALRRGGWVTSDLEQLDEDKQEEQSAAAVSLGAALAEAQRRATTNETQV
jgi:hypothetical protein